MTDLRLTHGAKNSEIRQKNKVVMSRVLNVSSYNGDGELIIVKYTVINGLRGSSAEL